MWVLLAHFNLDDALVVLDKMFSLLSLEEKQQNDPKALSQIYLHLSEQILQDILKKKNIATLWLKLEQLCIDEKVIPVSCMSNNDFIIIVCWDVRL